MNVPNKDYVIINALFGFFPLVLFFLFCIIFLFLDIGLPLFVLLLLFVIAAYSASVISLIVSACYHIHTSRVDYDLEKPRLDDYRDGYDHDWGKYNVDVAEYEATRKYAPIEKMSRTDVIKLMVTLTFWPVFVLKCIFDWLVSLFNPIIKTFVYIIGEKNEGDSDAEDRTVSDSSQ